MSKFMENVAVANSAARTFLAVLFVGGLGVGGYYSYQTFNSKELAIAKAEQNLLKTREELGLAQNQLKEKDQAIASLQVDVQEKQKEIDRLDTAMRLLKVDHRVARLTVLEQITEEDSGKMITRIEFQELDDQGQPIDAPKQFNVPGDVIYVDSWVVKFDDKYVEEADLHRATSLVLFRRIFGEDQKPLDGLALDEAGGRPKAYDRGGRISDFEKKIWSDFWAVANDEAKQNELGIRAAHGEAPSIKVQKGKAYRVELRASAGLTITPEGDAPKRADKPST
jgi:hypothetical protein